MLGRIARTMLFVAAGCGGSSAPTDLVDAAPPPKLSVAPDTVNFGTIAMGVSTTSSVTVRDIGDGAIAEGGLSATISGGQASNFTVDTTGCHAAVPPNTACSIVVGFDPTTVGAKSASLTVVARGAVISQSVALSGFGDTATP